MKRFSLRLSEAEYSKLKTYCKDLQISMNDVLRQLVREYVPRSKIGDQAINKENIADKSIN
ncbi:MAG: ribbon-helix-helix protein, CopG family [Xenococcus sp. MO_188.B8]|nr:ribbon-helix-helix protein, CopG family [Xenococcus sp. MO_188.B8]